MSFAAICAQREPHLRQGLAGPCSICDVAKHAAHARRHVAIPATMSFAAIRAQREPHLRQGLADPAVNAALFLGRQLRPSHVPCQRMQHLQEVHFDSLPAEHVATRGNMEQDEAPPGSAL
eukprot:1154469-Pelagomonas_calceolata.AAC.1